MTAWDAYQASFTELEANWTTMKSVADSFQLTTQDDIVKLRDQYGFQIADGTDANEHALSVHTAAEMQPAGRHDSDNPLLVGELFGGRVIDNEGGMPGEQPLVASSASNEVELGKQGERGLQRATGRVGAEANGVTQAEAGLATSLHSLQEKVHDTLAARAGLDGAVNGIAQTAGRRKRDEAAASLGAVQSSVSNAKGRIGVFFGIVDDFAKLGGHVAGGGFAGGIGEAPPSLGQNVSSGVSAGLGSNTLAAVANWAVDWQWEGRLSAARAALDQATAELERLVDEGDRIQLVKAKRVLAGAQAALQSARAGVKGALAVHRAAYEGMGFAAAERSGLRRGSEGYNRLRGAVASIPVAEVARTKAQMVVDVARHPQYTVKSGQGFGIARVNRDPSAMTFTTYLGYIGHIQAYYRKKADTWAERLTNLQEIASTLENNAPKT